VGCLRMCYTVLEGWDDYIYVICVTVRGGLGVYI
jgi:hypothetical protein